MGNSQSTTSSKLRIYIQTQKQFYNSGSIINGAVFVQVLDYFLFDALYIRVQGDQFCQWFQGSSKNRRKYVGNQNFYIQQHILSKYQNGISPGKYLYPFLMELSQNIPGSFQSQTNDARIRYKIIAYFTNFNQQMKMKICRYTSALLIRQPFRQEFSQYEGKITTQPKSFFRKGGEITLQAHFTKNVCFEGDEIKIRVSCDNTKGNLNVKRIKIKLVQYTFVSANNGADRTYRRVVDTQYIKQPIPKQTRADNMQLNFLISQKKNLSQSAISTLVANYYRLQVSTDIGLLTMNDPCIYSPIFIMKKQLKGGKVPRWSQDINQNQFQNKSKVQVFHAPEYWFKKNRNLDLLNFRLEDNAAPENQNYG